MGLLFSKCENEHKFFINTFGLTYENIDEKYNC